MSDESRGIVVVMAKDIGHADAMRDTLELEGYEAYSAADYGTALVAVREHQADVVMVPYWIDQPNKETGAVVEAALRADPATAHVSVLGYGFAQSVREGMWKPKHYLAAYYSPEDMVAAVAKALADDAW